ncbi:MAG: hypothetical protein JXR97_16430, partial [Planctomycetes bacterium]|nr:hypothetical protein [Planctomycetota bacterium]
AGLDLTLSPDAINALVMHQAPGDGNPTPGTAAFIETHMGDRLAVVHDPDFSINAALPWGAVDLKQDAIQSLKYVREQQPAYRLILNDGSELTVILQGGEMKIKTIRFGTAQIYPQAISCLLQIEKPVLPEVKAGTQEQPEKTPAEGGEDVAEKLKKKVSLKYEEVPFAEVLNDLRDKSGVKMIMDSKSLTKKDIEKREITLEVSDMPVEKAITWISELSDVKFKLVGDKVVFYNPDVEKEEGPNDDEVEVGIESPHLILAADNIMVGAFAVDELKIVSVSGAMPVKTDMIARIDRCEDDDAEIWPFVIDLREGGSLKGRFAEKVIRVNACGGSFYIPVEHLVSYISPMAGEKRGGKQKEDVEDEVAEDGGNKAKPGSVLKIEAKANQIKANRRVVH